MASYVQVANLDFDDIKESLKDYLRSKTDFNSYDFEGSAISVLLDVLAYNTYYTAFNTNMVVNELFLDSATLRDNVVTLAKQLGYRPKSKVAPVAYISFETNFIGNTPETIILKKGTGFSTIFDDVLYQYIAVDDHVRPIVDNVATFENIPVYEGTIITNNYVYNSSLLSQRFIIDNSNVDTSSIRVKVYESVTSTNYDTYEYADNILNADKNSKVFFLEEIEDERYEVFFGDGSIGRQLLNGERIEISYLITNGPITNGARTFTFNGVLTDKNDNLNYPFNINIDTTKTIPSNGGEDIEPISSIKYNAPKYFGTQDRAVTAQDYAALIRGRNIYPAISDIIVYGGEEERNPEYGKVKIAIKPKNSSFLSAVTKKEIVTKLKQYSVASVTPEIIDPSILFVEMYSLISFSKSKTTLKPEEIQSKVINNLKNYIESSDTEKFNGKFRYSKFLSTIDQSDRSITSNQTKIMMRKDFYPQINSKSYYEICYQNRFADPCDEPVVMSTKFYVSQYGTTAVFFEDLNGKIVLYTIDPTSSEKTILNNSLGVVDYTTGEVKINDLTIIKGSFIDNKIEVRVKPYYNDLIATRNVYLDVDMTKSKFNASPE